MRYTKIISYKMRDVKNLYSPGRWIIPVNKSFILPNRLINYKNYSIVNEPNNKVLYAYFGFCTEYEIINNGTMLQLATKQDLAETIYYKTCSINDPVFELVI